MKIEIKKATIKDLSNIQKLNKRLFEKEYKEYDKLLNLNWTFGKIGTKYFRDRITKDDGFVVVAIFENKIIGYLCGGLVKAEAYRNLPITAELENTMVLNEYRSMGIGKILHNKFLKWCKKKKVGKIRVQASAQNNLAINFYRKNGFKDYTLILERDI